MSIGLMVSMMVHANLTIPGISLNSTVNNTSQLAMTDPTLANTGLSANEDDMTSEQDINQLKLTESQLHEARVWGLSAEEEKRYVFLMQNRSAIYYQGLRQTPVDILGINARNASERNHFAQLSAAQEAQKVSKNIAWNNAFYRAYNDLFANVPVVGEFDVSAYAPSAYKPVMLNEGDTLFLFIKVDDPIKTVLLTLIDALRSSSHTRLNLMLLHVDEISIQQWANQNQIPHELVVNGQITLNHGDLNFDALNLNKKRTPLLLLARNGASSIVDLGKF